ncbi:MAG TPA: SDR family oxidoreductase [Acidimicrobiia bacterium]|nr:SDR family oxidoreductase [Acidimicrobiia bacterium]
MSDSYQRVAMITGASRGLGRTTALALVGAGWVVVADARNGEELFQAIGDEVVAVPGDVTDPNHRRDLVEAAHAAGGLDLLVNNASTLGPSPRPRLKDYPLDALRRVYEVNVLAPLALIQTALPLLRRRNGVIVNVTSDAGTEAYEGWGGYGSSKAALNQMSDILAVEETVVSVYRFDPGDMNTRMHQEAFPGEDISDRPDPEKSVPALLALMEGRPSSGAYRVGDALLSA